MAMSRNSELYQRLRLARNTALASAKRLPGVHPTSYICASAKALKDLHAEEYVYIAPGCSLEGSGISIGRYTMLAPGVAIVGDDHVWDRPDVPMQFAGRPPQRRTRIGRDVWLGRDVMVMRGVTIGDGAVVAARSVVTKDIPPREVWAGVPATKLRDRFTSEEEQHQHQAMVDGPVLEPSFAEPSLQCEMAEDEGGQPHLCIVTTAHPLDDVRVHSKVARSFVDAGWKVTWVGPQVSFFAGDDFRDPDLTYHLTPAIRSKKDRVLSVRRVTSAAHAVHGVTWWYSPDPDAAAITADLAQLRGGRTLLDIHEEYHGAHVDRWTLGREIPAAREAVRRRIAAICRRTNLVMGVNDSVLVPYTAGHPATQVVRNCAPRWFAERADAPAAPSEGVMTFMHGKALPTNGTPVVLEAAAQVEGARALIFPSTGTVDGPAYLPDLPQRIEAAGAGESVWLHDAVVHEDMPGVMAQCQVGMILYGRELGAASLPNRLFEYMASGLAIIAPSYSPEIERIISAEECGLTVDAEDPADVARAMRWAVEHPDEVAQMGQRARTAFIERHCWEAEFDGLLQAMHAQAPAESR